MNKKNITLKLIFFATLILTLLGNSIYYFTKKEILNVKLITEIKENKVIQHQLCLNENEQAEFRIERLGKYPSDDYDRGFIEIAVKNINTNQEISKFKIDNIINPSHYHPVELHQCNVYVIRVFNYDPNKTKQNPGYREELWKYRYNGGGETLVLLAEKPKEFISYFSPDFRISPNENYIILERGYLGRDDYALVIKDLKTLKDVFVLSAKSTFEQYPDMVGNFGLDKWTDDGRYFWGDIFDGAYVNAYFRIDIQNWKYDIFEAPDGAMGGSHLNINTGYLPIQPGQVWTGDYQLTQELKEKERKEGIKSKLYLYNLFTKDKIFIVDDEESLWWFKPQWLSDTELQYEMPTGEKKIYIVK